jgi:hypothetical protein
MKCEVCATETRWPSLAFTEIGYPRHIIPLRLQIRPKFVCDNCCTGDFHYLVTAPAMIRDGYRDWFNHLSMKNWFSVHCVEALQKHARILRAMPQRKPVPVTVMAENARYIPNVLRARVMERDNFSCRRCGAGPEEARLEIDHIQAYTKGGGTDMGNLQTLCHECNQGKRAREPHPHDTEARDTYVD